MRAEVPGRRVQYVRDHEARARRARLALLALHRHRQRVGRHRCPYRIQRCRRLTAPSPATSRFPSDAPAPPRPPNRLLNPVHFELRRERSAEAFRTQPAASDEITTVLLFNCAANQLIALAFQGMVT